MQTLSEAIKFVDENSNKGVECPCCKQHVQIYTRPLTSSMVVALIIFYQSKNVDADDFGHAEDILKESKANSSIRGDFPKLRFWGLIEPKSGEKNDGNKNNGLYKVTEKGEQFVQKLITVPATATIYNNTCIGFSEKQINIEEALKNKFNYNKLMTGEYI